MALAPGTRLGPYEVLSALGKGGMGEVWKARDTRLGRDVAIKTLPEAFASDADRLARFEREARLLASLNHPNIGGIHGLEEADGVTALVLELVEGETLADRLARGAIPVNEALGFALQIAAALEAAHERAVVHRDLKPGNIKITPEGKVKVLDFGLAKAFAEDGSSATAGHPTNSPTLSMAATQAGIILGTAAYMSPEQASGGASDKRADIWAFGVVLFEMLTGRQAFAGETIAHVLAAVLARDPSWNSLPPNLHPRLRELLERCLGKKATDRYRDIGDVRADIERVLADPAGTIGQPVEARAHAAAKSRLPWVAAVLAASLTTGVAVWSLLRTEAIPADVMRFVIVPPPDARMNLGGGRHDLAISPDGAKILYKGPADGPGPQLYVRLIDQLEGAPLRGTEGANGPFFSLDGEWVGFTDYRGNATLKKVSILGGPPITLAEAPDQIAGASWAADDTIVFGTEQGLFRVSGGGDGELESLTTTDRERNELHLWPSVIEGHDAILFVIATGTPLTTGQLAVLDTSTGKIRQLGLAGVSPRYVSTGHLVYASEDGSVRAAPFDARALEMTGNPVPLLEGVSVKVSGAANFGLSANGRLVYALGGPGGGPGVRRSLVWVDRNGREEAAGAEPRAYETFTLSPDGTRVAVEVSEAENSNVWIVDLERNTSTPLTFESGGDRFPLWTPDGTRVAFGSPLSWKRADGTGEVEVLSDGGPHFPQGFSPDTTALIFEDRSSEFDVGMLALDGKSAPTILLDGKFAERNGALSPDGRWLAYQSDESGRFEVYVRPFPDVDAGRWTVSTSSGEWPIWNPVGRELFFKSGDSLMALAYEDDPTFKPGALTELFTIPANADARAARRIAVSPDGQRFLFVTAGTAPGTDEEATPPQINVVINWHEELKARVGGGR